MGLSAREARSRAARWAAVLAGCCVAVSCSVGTTPPEPAAPRDSPQPAESTVSSPAVATSSTVRQPREVPAQGPRPRQPGSTGARPPADFNADGYSDLAVAKQLSRSGDGVGVGAIEVLYGSPEGFRPQARQQWSRRDLGESGGGGSFGFELTHGDFDGDGFSDLVAGDPYDTSANAGDLHVLYGTAEGLSTKRSQRWSLDTSGLPGRPADGDLFGSALAAGDLGHRRYDDLAVGIPGRAGGGAVLVLFGGQEGLAVDGAKLWGQNSASIPGRAEPDDAFGSAVVMGDFNADGHRELAIGASYDRVNGVQGAGSVYVMSGSSSGPTTRGVQQWTPGRGGLRGYPSETALFGDSLAVGAFTGGAHLDLAIGSPGWNSLDTGGAGSVHVLYGSDDGLTAEGNQQWTEYDVGTREPRNDQPEDSPLFGESLVAADFGFGPSDDLVVAVPEALTPGWVSGAVQIVYGTPAGLTPAHTRQFSQITPGIRGFDDDEARFGSSLSVLATTDDDYPTLVVGAPNYGGRDEEDHSGIVHLIRGSAMGLTAAQDEVLTSGAQRPEPKGEQFGRRTTS
jgi:hypothetical protein